MLDAARRLQANQAVDGHFAIRQDLIDRLGESLAEIGRSGATPATFFTICLKRAGEKLRRSRWPTTTSIFSDPGSVERLF